MHACILNANIECIITSEDTNKFNYWCMYKEGGVRSVKCVHQICMRSWVSGTMEGQMQFSTVARLNL